MMALATYRKKRTFHSTTEPRGGQPEDELLRFVVQKHQASRLHYDFRLEMKGTLKSWAIPKGPSVNPEDKRLAMEVEDHPYDYKDFEGIIPEGNYGAGAVIIWDEGTYEPVENFRDKKKAERELLRQWKEGNIKFRLHGHKLKGDFALIRMKGDEKNAWLLIKHKDKYASSGNITLKGKSVVSDKTIEQLVKATPKGKKASIRPRQPQRKHSGTTKEARDESPAENSRVPAILQKAARVPFPKRLFPMLATSVAEPFDDPEWIYEVKWDGYRTIGYRNKNITLLQSRNGKSFEKKFSPVFKAIRQWDVKAVVDGEIIVAGRNGIPDFNKLQNWKSEQDGLLQYYIFDLLWYEGRDITQLPLEERKVILDSIVPADHDTIKISAVFPSGIELFKGITGLGLEGMIAKRSGALYYPGQRTRNWLKIKSQHRQEAVICGYTKNEGSARPFSALLLGIYDDHRLLYAGKVGTGFKESEQKQLLTLFRKYRRKNSPYHNMSELIASSPFRPVLSKKTMWLEPELVCEIHFEEITADGVFRHPSFIALREDKPASSVILEKAITMKDNPKKRSKNKPPGQVESRRKDPPEYTGKKLVHTISGKELIFTNLDKPLWPDDGYTKGDMMSYYQSIAKYILPYLKDRPQSLHRFPNGIYGNSFYQKDVTGKVPEWITLYPYKAEGERKQKHYMLCNDQAALLYMINLGCIEINPWSSTIQFPDYPTWCVLDIDPDKSNTFDQAIEVARHIFELLEGLKIPSYCKTSGSTGLHVYIPLKNQYTYEQSQLFAKWVATEINRQLDFTSIERMTDKRKGKIYIDFLQNRASATLAAPYSIRPKPGATVSMPLYWNEVKKGLKTADFTIKNALKRIQSEGDIFRKVLGKGINLKKVLHNI